MKKRVRREYELRVNKILKTALDGRKTIQAINTWAMPVIRYGAGIIKWPKLELLDIDRKTRKRLTAAGAHHPQADVDRLYCDRKAGGRGLMSVEECVRREENALAVFVESTESEGILRLKKWLKREGVVIGELIEKDEDKEIREMKRSMERESNAWPVPERFRTSSTK